MTGPRVIAPREPDASPRDDVRTGPLLLVALAGWIGVALVHVVLRSMVNSGRPWGPLDAWPRMIEHEVELHAQWAPFVRRPVMNHVLAGLASATGWSVWTRFVVAQLAALGWAAVEMALTARDVARWRGDGPMYARRALVMFFVYPAVLFAWFRPVYTFDDLVIAALVVHAVRCVVGQRWFAAAGLLSVAAVGHEVALFMLPSLTWLAWDRSGRRRRVAILLVAPVVAWLVVRGTMYGVRGGVTESWATILTANFGTPRDAISSAGAVVLAIGLPGVFVTAGTAPPPARLGRTYGLALAVTLPIVAVAAYLREFRLAALAGYVVLPFLRFRFAALALTDRWQVIAALAAGAAVALLYHPVIASAPWPFRIYAGVIVGLFASLGLARLRRGGADQRSPK